MNQSSSANGKKISSPDSSEVFDTSPSKTYHEQAYIDPDFTSSGNSEDTSCICKRLFSCR